MLNDRAILCSALCGVYRIIVASAPLLEFAIPRSEGAVRDYYIEHLAEERGHDEMLLDDLKRLGVTDVPPSFFAAQLAGSQYYIIAHEHPAMLLGYMLALESNTLSVSSVDELSRHHGVELTALRHHAEHDPLHNRDLKEVIQSLAPELQERVMWNARHVAEIIGRPL